MASNYGAAKDSPIREYIRFEIVDFNCKALSKTVPGRHRESSVFMYAGALSTGANQEVLVIPEEILAAGCPNTKLLPDWSTEQVLPWACRPEKGIRVKRVYCEQANLEVVPRTICRRMLKELGAFDGQGLQMLVGGELEFVLAKPEGPSDSETWVPLFNGPEIFTTLQNCKAMDFCYEVEHQMQSVGVDVQTINAEHGVGQVEITFVPKFGIEAADMTATFRTGTKEIAQSQGLRATFMAKPFGVKGSGNGGHLNFSIWHPGPQKTTATAGGAQDALSRVTAGFENALHAADDAGGLSAMARCFLAGILAHGPALEAICSPTPPCYCRHGNFAPVVADWGFDDRSACVRVKSDPTGAAGSCYMEFRMPSASANPYLVIAAVVASGMDGLQKGLQLPPARQTKEQGALPLPSSLCEALAALEADAYLVSKLGQDFVRWFVGVKRGEMAKLEERLQGTQRSDADISAAWQHMYMEFV